MNISELKKRYKYAIEKKHTILVNQREYSEQVFKELEGWLLEKGYQKRPVQSQVKFVGFDPIQKERKEYIYEIDE